jgi:TRAP-type C4-dicarboxylate transport system substrate-binding protein
MSAPVTKLRDGLAKKVFDGTAFTSEAVEGFKISKFIKHATIIPGGLYNVSFAMTMNLQKWNKISAKDKATINSMAGEKLGARRIARKWDERDVTAPATLQAAGVTYNTIKGQALADLKIKFAVFETRWIAKAKKRGVDGVAALKMFRAEVAAYKKP